MSTKKLRPTLTLTTLMIASGLVACADEPGPMGDEALAEAELELAGVSTDCDPDALTGVDQMKCEMARRKEARRLFKHETFGGNGRTCETCHNPKTGTINPEQVKERFQADPNDPLFVWDGLDDFVSGTSRIEEAATILVERPLPPNITLADDPSATSVVIERGVFSTVNAAAAGPSFMWDLRNPDLQSQADEAIVAHNEPTEAPSALDLELIEEFQQTDSRFFSDQAIEDYAKGGPAPGLPEGNSPSEKRGREFFVDSPWNPPSKKGICALCHSGPMLNESNFASTAAIGNPPGWPIFDTQVTLANRRNLPEKTYLIEDACGNVVPRTTSDLGILYTDLWSVPELAPFLPPAFLCIVHPAFVANMFKTPTLRGIRHTAPYFHDNSAATLREATEHYNFFFEVDPSPIGQVGLHLTDQDIDDIVAFMKLL